MNNEKTNKVKELTAIEWRIYDYLLEKTRNNEWVSQNQIYDYLLNLGFNLTMRNMRQHIWNIRACDLVHKIIISNTNLGYKMLSDLEEEKYLESKKIEALKKLKQYYKDCERLKINGQGRIAFTQEEKDFIESVVRVNEF